MSTINITRGLDAPFTGLTRFTSTTWINSRSTNSFNATSFLKLFSSFYLLNCSFYSSVSRLFGSISNYSSLFVINLADVYQLKFGSLSYSAEFSASIISFLQIIYLNGSTISFGTDEVPSDDLSVYFDIFYNTYITPVVSNPVYLTINLNESFISGVKVHSGYWVDNLQFD